MAMLVLDEGALIGTADGHSGGACAETCTLFIMPCAKQRNVVLVVIWSFVIMANPGDTTGTVGAQQMVPITKLRSTISEMVKEDTPPKTNVTLLRYHRSFLTVRDDRKPPVPSDIACKYNRVNACMVSATCMHWYELYWYNRVGRIR